MVKAQLNNWNYRHNSLKITVYVFLIAILILNLGLLQFALKIPTDSKPERLSNLITNVEQGQVETNKDWILLKLRSFEKYAFASDQLVGAFKKLVVLMAFSNILVMTVFGFCLLRSKTLTKGIGV